MIEVYIPPEVSVGRPRIRIESHGDLRALFSVFTLIGDNCSTDGEVVMAALADDATLLAVVAFGEVNLEAIVDDPRPLVLLAGTFGCPMVMLGQIGRTAEETTDACRIIGAALAVDDIELIDWIDLDPASLRAYE